MKKLYLIRHGKSSWDDDEISDFDRSLKNRGVKNAYEMVERLKNKEYGEIILESTKYRTSVFIIYQLTSKEFKFGIASGYYDECDKGDNGGINKIMNDYLFDVCFNPVNKNNLIITSTSGMIGQNITELKTTTTGDDNGVVVNFKYLLDGLNNIDSNNVKIEVINNSTPCILKSENNDDYLYIIMPIRQ